MTIACESPGVWSSPQGRRIPHDVWCDPGLPDARTALYSLLRGGREVLFRTDGFLTGPQEREAASHRVRDKARRLKMRVRINWVGSIESDDDDSRTVWMVTMTGRLT